MLRVTAMCGRDEWARNGGESAKLNGRVDDVMLCQYLLVTLPVTTAANLVSFLILKLP